MRAGFTGFQNLLICVCNHLWWDVGYSSVSCAVLAVMDVLLLQCFLPWSSKMKVRALMWLYSHVIMWPSVCHQFPPPSLNTLGKKKKQTKKFKRKVMGFLWGSQNSGLDFLVWVSHRLRTRGMKSPNELIKHLCGSRVDMGSGLLCILYLP